MDPSALNADEERVVHAFVEKVNKFRHDSPISWNESMKFVMARKFDLQRAVDLYIQHKLTRDKEGLFEINPSDSDLQQELNTEKFTILSGRDSRGAALALFTARLHIPNKFSHQVVLKALIYQLDTALQSLETQRHGLVFIYDMTDSKYANFDYELSIKILNLLKGAYPARLKKVLIVTAPLWFKAPFKILRLFVREKLRDRVYTINRSEILAHIPKDALPQRFGGSLVTNHKAWLQVCNSLWTNQNPDINSYFVSRGRLPSVRKSRNTSISCHSLSSDNEENVFGNNDIGSESSKETISEKHSVEGCEKEGEKKDENSVEKEVNYEKDENSVNSKRRRESGDDHIDSGKSLAANNGALENDIGDGQDVPRKKRPTSGGSNILEDSIHMPEEGGQTISELVDFVKSVRRKGLHEQYALIRREPPPGTFNVSRAKYNLPKNRYSDVLCLDHSRVVLPQVDGDPSSDYINANYVDGYMHKNAYISTQGPLPKTFGDFWRMVWLTQCAVVVMTTRAMERGRMKCGQYWPVGEEAEDQFEEFIVINTGIEQNREYTITGLLLHNTKTGESRPITHLQFTSWPDYGIPPTSGFLDFLFRVRGCQADATRILGPAWQGHPNGPPIVVHCSAGIGRTGTFITIDICLQRLEHISTVNIAETVRKIRSQRAFSIQMPDQFVFCHLGVIDYAVKQELISEVDWSNFEDSDSDTE